MKAHFVGIGGIGMSALARYFCSKGVEVTGSDAGASPLLEELRTEGIVIFPEHDADNIDPQVYEVIYSEAIPPDNPERQRATELKIPQKSYFAALGDISKTIPTVSICGTHGKSTTTAMAGLALEAALVDPLVILGTKVFEWGAKNIRLAGPPVLCQERDCGLFVVESCEYHNSFLHLSPTIIIVTNCEPDHLDFFGSEEKYFEAFRAFATRLPDTGILIADFSDARIRELFGSIAARTIDAADFLAKVPTMAIPGEHNRQNAALVLALFAALELPEQTAQASLARFRGTWRRFEYKGEIDGIQVFDDYAHHPTEVRATLAAFREKFPDKRIWAVFQPHQYSRTREFLDEFAASFADADEVLIPNIYRVRDSEEDVQSVSAEQLVDKINAAGTKARHTHDFAQTVDLLKTEAQPSDVVVSIGAGPVHQVAEGVLENF